MTTPVLRPLRPTDIEAAIELWRRTPGIGLNPTDEPAPLNAFLSRNPELSLVATVNDVLVGTLLVGHDGRRGFLYHLAVEVGHRRKGIGDRLVQLALQNLAAHGISRTTVHVFADNDEGKAFWLSRGWVDRPDIRMLQFIQPPPPN